MREAIEKCIFKKTFAWSCISVSNDSSGNCSSGI